jgi:DNA-binding transcriptional ArsR family regulator
MSDELLDVSTPEQFKALGHPTRHRLLFALDRPATISQLAATLGIHKGNVAHHLKMLAAAGLVRHGETRQVRGGTERYYERAARALQLSGEHAAANLPVALQAVAQEIAAAMPDPLLTLRHLRLTAEQASQLAATLTALAHDIDDAGDNEPRYGLLVGLYQQTASIVPQ